MQKHQFLFLTNVNNTYPALFKFTNQFPEEFDFIIHTSEKENEHYSDLRNMKIIKNRISENTIIIFYLVGNLSIYVIDEYFKKFPKQKRKIIYVFSSLNLFYSQNYLPHITTKQAIKIIESKAEDYLFISVLMTEEKYEKNFEKFNKKYFFQNSQIGNLRIPNENLFEEIVRLSAGDSNGSTIHLISEKYNIVKIAIKQIKFNSFNELFNKTIFKVRHFNSFLIEYNALVQFGNKFPKLENLILINTDTQQTKSPIQTNIHYPENTENRNSFFNKIKKEKTMGKIFNNLFVLFLFSAILISTQKSNGQNVTVGSGITLSLNSSNLTLYGDFTINGTFNCGTGTVEFNGATGNQSIVNTDPFYNLILNKASGNVVASNTITVNNQLTCTSGNLDLSNHSCSLGTNAMLSEAAGMEVMDGTISISKTLDNPASVNSGGLGAEITSSSNLGSTSITRGSAIQTANSNSSIKRYYDITPTTNTGLNASFVFHYDPADLNGLTESELVLFRSTDNGITWTQEGGTVNTSSHIVTLGGINSFSRWTLGSSTSPLPVELTSFTANVIDNKKVLLSWQTATEVNNYGFEVERQASSSTTHGQDASNLRGQGTQNGNSDLEGYTTIGFVQGNGNSNSPKLYSFTDNKLIGGSDFAYRLKQIDINGSFKYSDIVNVCVIPGKYKLSQNYPNPFNPTTKISYEIPENGFVSLKVFNELGKEVRTLVKKNQQSGKYEASFDATGTASGIYFARLHVNNYTKIVKMILLK